MNLNEQCNELARTAMGLAYRVATFKPMGYFNDPQRVVALADAVIALRTNEAREQAAGEVQS
jgi:hypothetical protein